jgi:hypothetical protein
MDSPILPYPSSSSNPLEQLPTSSFPPSKVNATYFTTYSQSLHRDYNLPSSSFYNKPLLRAVYDKRPSLCPSKTSRPSVSLCHPFLPCCVEVLESGDKCHRSQDRLYLFFLSASLGHLPLDEYWFPLTRHSCDLRGPLVAG